MRSTPSSPATRSRSSWCVVRRRSGCDSRRGWGDAASATTMTPKPIPQPTAYGVTRTTGEGLYWCTYGPAGAPRLLVLHGGPGAHHDYLLPQLLGLSELGDRGHELLFYDQRGGGRSKTASAGEPITWRTQVEDLAEVIREFDLERPIIVGY